MNIKDIKIYFNVKKELSKKCQDYFLKHKPFEGAYYSGWDFINENSIEITYSYTDFYYNTDLYTEYDSIIISIEDLLKNE